MRYSLSSRFDSRSAQRWAICLFVIGVFVKPGYCADAVAQDKRIEVLVGLLGSENFDEREKAVRDLVEIGMPAMKALQRAAESEDAEVSRRAKACIPEIEQNDKAMNLALRLMSKSINERVDAAEMVPELGPAAHKVVPALIYALDDDDYFVKRSVLKALEYIGPLANLAVPKLIKLLEEKSNGVDLRKSAMRTLCKLGPHAREAAPLLLHMLATECIELQSRAAYSLGQLGQDDSRVIPSLINVLDNNTTGVGLNAAAALIELKKEPLHSIPALIRFVKKHKNDPDWEQPMYCIASEFGRFGQDAKLAVPFLIEILSNDDVPERVRCGAAKGLGAIGPSAKSAIPVLKDLQRADQRKKGLFQFEAAISDSLIDIQR